MAIYVLHAVRHLLPEYGGYECKEPEPGKFTLAFRCANAHLSLRDGHQLQALFECKAIYGAPMQLGWPRPCCSRPHCTGRSMQHS